MLNRYKDHKVKTRPNQIHNKMSSRTALSKGGNTLLQSIPLGLGDLLKSKFKSVSGKRHELENEGFQSEASTTFMLPKPAAVAEDESVARSLEQLLSTEFELGNQSLTRWRKAYHNKFNWSKHAADGGDCSKFLERLCPQVAGGGDEKQQHASRIAADRQLIKDAVMIGNCVVSPFVALAGSTTPSTDDASSPLANTSTFIAARNIPAGVFLMSVPTEAVLSAEGGEGAAVLAAYHADLEGDEDSRRQLATSAARHGLLLSDVLSGNVFMLSVEELAMQLAASMCPEEEEVDLRGEADEGNNFTDAYVKYLLQSVKPPKNLPYLAEAEIGDVNAQEPTSTIHALWRFFHKYQKQQPLNLAAFRQLLLGESYDEQLAYFYRRAHGAHAPLPSSSLMEQQPNIIAVSKTLPPLPADALAEYHWLVSVALSRRLGGTVMCPLVDKLNHCVNTTAAANNCAEASAEPSAQGGEQQRANQGHPAPEQSPPQHAPNAYYTMATTEALCGVDVFDNLVAGVSADRLYVPHVHVFSLRSIRKGDPITISYSDVDPTTAMAKGGEYDGAALWKCFWGFRPIAKATLSESDLLSMASITAERRLLQRKAMFP